MKKYKLIKKYPKSPKLGTTLTFGVGWGDTEHWIKNHPEEAKEFWEEIIELNFEILSFRNNMDTYNKYTTLLEDGTYSCTKESGASLEWCLNQKGYEINSIKRLSDNEIFSVGDKVNKNTKISRISFCWDKKLFIDYKGIPPTFSSSGSVVDVENLKHYKEPLFTTEDGYEIFDKMELLWDTSDDVPTYLDTTSAKWFSEVVYCKNSNFKYRKAWKLEENALRYTEDNKPKFSKKDIKKAVYKCNMSTSIGNFIKEEDLFNNLNI